MRCLTDLTMEDKVSGLSLEKGQGGGPDVDEQLGEFDISPLVMKRELRRTLEENHFEHIEYVFEDGHFSFHRGRLVASPGISEDEDEPCVILEDEGWEAVLEGVMGDIPSLLSQPETSPCCLSDKIRTELEHLPVLRDQDKKKRKNTMNAANQTTTIPAGSCFVFLVDYDDESKFEDFDRMLRQEPFVIGTDGSSDRGACKITIIS